MEWSWYYLIPISITLIVAAIWLTVFFMSYKNTKNVKTAIAEAKETLEAFKGDTNMASLRFPAQKAETEEVKATETPVEVTTAPKTAKAEEIPVAAENKATEKEIPAFVKRMQYELQDLESKIYKLSAFIESAEQFNKLDEANKQLLKAQHGTMCAYYEILRRRVLLNMEQ